MARKQIDEQPREGAAARELLKQANEQLVAADARTREAEEQRDELKRRVQDLLVALETSEARRRAAEDRLATTMRVLGPALVSRLRRLG